MTTLEEQDRGKCVMSVVKIEGAYRWPRKKKFMLVAMVGQD